MRLLVVAQSAADFADWLGRQRQDAATPAGDLARRGLQVFRDKTCVNCHEIKGASPATSVAPDLTHVASRTTLGSGVLDNSEDAVRLWLANPQAVKPGCRMPDFHLEQADVAALTAYLETLK
jgi:cytochrome c oxidase subunit 2